MRNLLYILVLIIVTVWSVGFIGYDIGGLIHLLPVIATLLVILSFLHDKREFEL